MKFLLKLLPGAAAVAVCLLVAGCGTVAPKPVFSSEPSWDGTNQNSGFLGWAPDGRGVLSAGAYLRYNDLAGRYGARFAPALAAGAGCVGTGTNTWLIDQEHLADFATMSRWKRSGK